MARLLFGPKSTQEVQAPHKKISCSRCDFGINMYILPLVIFSPTKAKKNKSSAGVNFRSPILLPAIQNDILLAVRKGRVGEQQWIKRR